MPINFTQILKDSWNFIQNEKPIAVRLSILFFVVNLCITFFNSIFLPEEIAPITLDSNGMPNNIPYETAVGLINALLAKQFVYILVSAWGIMIIHQISQHRFSSVIDSLSMTLKRLMGVVALFIAIIAPLMIGLTQSMIAIQQKIPPSTLSILEIIFGLGLYVRLCLSPIRYLLTNSTLGNSIKTIISAGTGRVSSLLILCLLIYVVLPLIENYLLQLSVNSFMAILMNVIDSFINAFALIVIYRFYTLFVPKA